MRRIEVSLAVLFLVTAAAASAQNNRSAVSINGSDLNPCTTTSPCRSFSAALAQTNLGGEVIALDSGGYGPFSATQAVTVSGAPGVHAAITAGGANGVNVNAGATDAVFLRNLVILAGSSDGIRINSAGTVHISNTLVRGFSIVGIRVAAPVETEIDHAVVQDTDDGIDVVASPSIFVARITNSQLDDNSLAGADVGENARVLIANTSATGNNVGVRAISHTNGVAADVTLDHLDIAGNNIGIYGQAPDANLNATIRLYGSVISYNSGAGIQCSVCTVYSYGNNAISANNPDLSGVALTLLPQQ